MVKAVQEIGIKPPPISYGKSELSHHKNRAESPHKAIIKKVQEIGIKLPWKLYRNLVLNHHKSVQEVGIKPP